MATGMPTASASNEVCAITSSSVTSPSARPSVNANPELVVASALKPSSSSIRAEPASHGFGITNGSPSWRARNSAALLSDKLVLVSGYRPLVAFDVRRPRGRIDLAADLLDAEERADLVAHVRRHRERHADQRCRPRRNDHFELGPLQCLRDRLRHLVGLDH